MSPLHLHYQPQSLFRVQTGTSLCLLREFPLRDEVFDESCLYRLFQLVAGREVGEKNEPKLGQEHFINTNTDHTDAL